MKEVTKIERVILISLAVLVFGAAVVVAGSLGGLRSEYFLLSTILIVAFMVSLAFLPLPWYASPILRACLAACLLPVGYVGAWLMMWADFHLPSPNSHLPALAMLTGLLCVLAGGIPFFCHIARER